MAKIQDPNYEKAGSWLSEDRCCEQAISNTGSEQQIIDAEPGAPVGEVK